uniref:Golgin subfamily A conserved domain-containing protein n=1 Tax=Gorilla gorilla gorilla TaxID=9595 RepID=G3R5C5_GORGO
MAEETRQSKLAAAKKKFKEYWQRNRPGVPAAAKRNRKANGSSPETAASGGCHSSEASSSASSSLHAPQSPCQEQAAVLDSRSIKISRLNDTIKSLKQQKKQVEHYSVFLFLQEKKANNERQKAERELEVSGGCHLLGFSPKGSNPEIEHREKETKYGPSFEPHLNSSKDLAVRLQRSSQHIGELEWSLCAVAATPKKKPDGFSSRSKALLKWQLEQSIREQILLKGHMTQKSSWREINMAQWQQRMRKMSQEVCTLKTEKEHYTHRGEELEMSLSKLKNQTAEPLPPDPAAVSSEVELQDLRKELGRVAGELQAQVENNQRISLLNRGQKESLHEQEERLREQEKRLQQLAEPQNDLEELKNENKSALQLEQQVKELQEKLGQVTEMLTSAEKEPEAAVPASGTGDESSGLMDLLEEKADLREHVDKLELGFIQYRRERCHQKVHRLLTEPGDSAKDAAPGGGHHQAGPGQGGEEGEAAGAAGDGVAAYGNYSEGHGKFLAAARNPAAEPSPGAPAPQELGAADKHGDLCEVSLTNSVEPAQGEAREGSSQDNPTAQPIVQLFGEMQDHQEHPGLGSNCCVPCFCWAWLPRRRR